MEALEYAKKIRKEHLRLTLDDVVALDKNYDINAVLKALKSEGEPLEHILGKGLADDKAFSAMLESIGVFEILESSVNEDDSVRYMSSENSGKYFSINVNSFICENGYNETCFDFNSIKECDYSDIIDEQAIEDFFQSANFLAVPGMENEEDGNLSKFLWDDFKKVSEILSEKAGELFVYTLTDSEGFGLITKGYKRVNRIGYFLADKDIDMGKEEAVRYW